MAFDASMKKDELIFHLWRWSRKKMLVMKFVVLMVLLPVITFAIPAYSQKQIKMDVQGVSLEQVLKELQVQSGYYILYNKQDVQGVKNVSLKVDGSSVKEVLELCLRNTSLQYAIEDQTILISLKKAGIEPEKKESVIIKGVVKDSKGSVLPGVTVIIKGTSVGTATGIDGNFSLNLVKQDTATLLFSFVLFFQIQHIQIHQSFDFVQHLSHLHIHNLLQFFPLFHQLPLYVY